MLHELLKYICESLEKNKIEYMLSGSMALITYAIPRLTRDIDIVIDINIDDADKFISCFKEGFYFNEKTVKHEILRQGMFNLIDHSTGYKIDFIIKKESEFRINEFKRKIRIHDFGFPCWIVTREDLILSKLIWIQKIQSNTQIEDIKNLITHETDMEYLKYWIEKLNLQTFHIL